MKDVLETVESKEKDWKVKVKEITEPYIKAQIFAPSLYIGPIMELCQNKRGTYIGLEYIDKTRVNKRMNYHCQK